MTSPPFKKQLIAAIADQNEDAHNEPPTSEPPKDDINDSNRKPSQIISQSHLTQ